MLNLNSLMIGTMRPEVLGPFYEKFLGKPAESDPEQGYWAWQAGSTNLSVMRHSEAAGNAKDPARFMFNFETTQVKEAFETIKAAGATVIREPYEIGGGWVATLADPDGNYFQLVTPMP